MNPIMPSLIVNHNIPLLGNGSNISDHPGRVTNKDTLYLLHEVTGVSNHEPEVIPLIRRDIKTAAAKGVEILLNNASVNGTVVQSKLSVGDKLKLEGLYVTLSQLEAKQ